MKEEKVCCGETFTRGSHMCECCLSNSQNYITAEGKFWANHVHRPPPGYEDVQGAALCKNCAGKNGALTWVGVAERIRRNRMEKLLVAGYSVDEAKVKSASRDAPQKASPGTKCFLCDAREGSELWLSSRPADIRGKQICGVCYAPFVDAGRTEQTEALYHAIREKLARNKAPSAVEAYHIPNRILYPINMCIMATDGDDNGRCLWYEQYEENLGIWGYASDLFHEQRAAGGQFTMAALNQCYRLAEYRMTEAARGLHALCAWLYDGKTSMDRRAPQIRLIGKPILV